MKVLSSKWLYLFVFAVILGIVVLIQPPVFYLNDDMTIRSILKGAYSGTPDGHTVYMQYPLTGILAALYRFVSFVPWLELFYTVCFLVCMVLFAGLFRNPPLGCLAAVVLYVPFYVYMHYTLVAALIAATAVFLLGAGKRGAWPLILIVMAYLIRNEVGLLALPYVACAMVWQVVILPKEQWKKEIIAKVKQCGCLLGILLVCFLINYAFYSSPEWKEYGEYNKGRTLLYDYTDFLSTDYYEQNYADYGMTEEEYHLLSSYNIMLDEGLNRDKMQQVSETVAARLQKNMSVGERCIDTVQKYYLHMRYNDLPYNYIWLILVLLLGLGFLCTKKWKQLIILTILLAGRSAIWFSLIWQGRFPQRISLTLYIVELLLLLSMGIGFLKETGLLRTNSEKWISVGLCLVLVALGVFQWSNTNAKIEKQVQLQSEWMALCEYCEASADITYLTDVFSVVKYAGTHYSSDCENIMILGGWMSYSPLAQERLMQLNARDAAQALVNGENVKLLVAKDKDITWLEGYLQNRFGHVELELVDEICISSNASFNIYNVN